MGAEPLQTLEGSSGGQSSLLEAHLLAKGLATIDDIDAEPLRQLQPHHILYIHLEHCTAQRPAFSLRGTREKYESQAMLIEECVEQFRGDGDVKVLHNVPPGAPPGRPSSAAGALGSGSPSGRQSRPQSAGSVRTPNWGSGNAMTTSHGLGKMGLAPTTQFPRIGAFEVGVSLRNIATSTTYGPEPLASKLATGRWPSHKKVTTALSEHLQRWLKQDERSFALENAVRKEVEQQQNSPPKQPSLAVDTVDSSAEASALARDTPLEQR